MTTRRRFLMLSGQSAAGLMAFRLGSWSDSRAAAPDRERRAAFLRAVRAGDLAVVKALLVAAPELAGARDAAGCSVLVLAYLGQHEEVARALLEQEPPLGLVEAALIPDWELAERLAREDSQALDAWHPIGGTALYAMARCARSGFWRLQHQGADTDGNPKGAQGVTPAYGALECPSASDAWRGATSLLSNGGNVNAAQRGGDSLLHVAARRGDLALVRYLLRRGARTDARDAGGATPREQAVERGHGRVAELLADVRQVERDSTATRYAFDAGGDAVQWHDLSEVEIELQNEVVTCSHRDMPAVRQRVDSDRRLTFSRSVQDELPVEAAAHAGSRDILRYHLDHGAPMTIATALSLGDLERARTLLAADPLGIHERGPHDFALMWYASIGGGNPAAADLLLEFGAPVDQDSVGTTTLHRAAARGQLELLALLLEHGAEPNAVGYQSQREGRTPLQLAQAQGQDAAVRLLREHGAK